MRKFLLLLMSLIILTVSVAACGEAGENGGNSADSQDYNPTLTIMNDSVIYYDELVDGKVALDIKVSGAKSDAKKYVLDQVNNFVSLSSDGIISISNGVTDNYQFTVTAVLDEKRSVYDAVDFRIYLTRGLLQGDKQVGQVIVSVNGDPSVSRGISWFSTADVEESTVLVSVNKDMSAPVKYNGELNVFEKIAEAGDKQKTAFYNHQCVIDNLKPDTRYYYQVGSESMGLYSAIGTFKTTGASGAVKFMVTTDVHIGANEKPNASSRFYNAALSDALSRDSGIEFAINTGDMVTQWNGGYSYFEYEWARAMQLSPLLKQVTYVTMSGNHDQKQAKGGASTYKEFEYSLVNHYSLPKSPALIDDGNIHGPSYSFDVANVHFIVMNIYDYDQAPEEVAKVKSWVEYDLANTDKQWKVAFSHREVPDDVKAVLEANGVVVAYSGHEHYFSQSKPMLGGAVQEMVYSADNVHLVNPKGTTYITNSTTGGGDEFCAAPPATDATLDSFGKGTTIADMGTVNTRWGMYTIVSIDGDTFTAEIYVRPGTTATGEFKLYKRYGYIIQK